MMTFVIYHKSDYDGIFCREIAKKFLPDATLIGWEYGEPEPIIPDSALVYMLDISISGLMSHPHLIWIDHHKSAIDKYPQDINGYRIDGVAACRLAFQWFKGNLYPPKKNDYVERTIEEPYAVRLAGEYDIWDKRDPNAELFQHGLRSQELISSDWELLLSFDTTLVDKLLRQGQTLQYAKTKENESIIKNQSFDLIFEGFTFLCCNHARYNSFLFLSELKPYHDACLGFCWDGKMKKWKVSLYHAPGKEFHDLSILAVKHGGGGHKGACGFTCKHLPFSLE